MNIHFLLKHTYAISFHKYNVVSISLVRNKMQIFNKGLCMYSRLLLTAMERENLINPQWTFATFCYTIKSIHPHTYIFCYSKNEFMERRNNAISFQQKQPPVSVLLNRHLPVKNDSLRIAGNGWFPLVSSMSNWCTSPLMRYNFRWKSSMVGVYESSNLPPKKRDTNDVLPTRADL